MKKTEKKIKPPLAQKLVKMAIGDDLSFVINSKKTQTANFTLMWSGTKKEKLAAPLA